MVFHFNILYEEDNVNLSEFLDENYPDISSSIKMEGYAVEYQNFHLFYELYFNDEVVGFVSIDNFHIVPTDLVINECYVMPEFRGNDIFANMLANLIVNPNFTYHLRNPNRILIEVLLKNGFAFKFADNLVASYIKFVFDLDTVYKNPKIKRFYKTPDIDIPYKANIFDLDLCCVVFTDPMLNFIKYSDVVALTLPRKGDLKKYKLRKKLKRITEKYLDRCYDARMDYDDDILEFLATVEDDINELVSIERTLGTEDKLNDDFRQCLIEHDLSDDDGFRIIESISNALENGELTVKSCPCRMQYLVRNIDNINGVDVDGDDRCPFCGEQIIEFLDTCEACGEKLRDESFEDELKKDLERFNMEEFLDGIDEEKFHEMLESDEFWGRVPIEENDPYFDLKTFYNENLTFFDFEEIREYYEKSDKSLDFAEMFEKYFDDRIADCKDQDDRFDMYKDFLINYFYYNLDNQKFNVALTYLVQLVILASNCDSIFIGADVVQRSAHSADITLGIEEFLKYADDYDLEKCLDDAFATFKVDKWNNNKDEIYEVLPQYF